jgi:DNA-directed RNA polymerase specialized sigma24 family protein
MRPPDFFRKEKRMCSRCPKRTACSAICPKVARLLPDPDAGKIHFNGHDPQDVLKTFVLGRELAAALTSRRDALKGVKRAAFDLRMNKGLTQLEIARKLGVSRKTAAFHLAGAIKAVAASMRRSRLIAAVNNI